MTPSLFALISLAQALGRDCSKVADEQDALALIAGEVCRRKWSKTEVPKTGERVQVDYMSATGTFRMRIGWELSPEGRERIRQGQLRRSATERRRSARLGAERQRLRAMSA